MIRIRRPSILFALSSAIYWELVANVVGSTNQLAGHYVAPYWLVILVNVIPTMLYAVVTLFFCHWLVRRALRQAQKKVN